MRSPTQKYYSDSLGGFMLSADMISVQFLLLLDPSQVVTGNLFRLRFLCLVPVADHCPHEGVLHRSSQEPEISSLMAKKLAENSARQDAADDALKIFLWPKGNTLYMHTYIYIWN